jgi:hypothetical protein
MRGAMTLSMTKFSIMTFDIMTLSIKGSAYMRVTINATA